MKAETLKKAILQYAMEGKLVAQDLNDEPASELLKRIKAEKEQLIKDGKLKKEKPLPPITEDEIPYELPQGWEWVRVNDVGVYKKGPFGSALTKKIFVPKGQNSIKVYEQKNAIQKDETLGEYYITKEYYESSMKSFTVESGDVIVSCAGTIGETFIMPNNIELGIINQALMRMRITKEINIHYFLLYFDIILKRNSISYSKGSAIKNIPPFDIFKKMLVPIPPLEEQKRIVEKLEKILPLVDEYGKNEEKLSKLNETLPKKIRQSILQHAVQGKLVLQNSNDEPASELLKRIKAEKEQLIKDGKLKKEKPLPPITEEEIPYELPQSWEWVRLDELSQNIHYGYNGSANYSIKEPKLVRITDIQNNRINWENVPACEIKEKDINTYRLQNNDILIARTGGTMGKTYIVQDIQCKAIFASYLIRCIPLSLNAKYLKLFMESPLYWQQLYDKASGTGQPNVNGTSLKSMLVSLPPLEEQKRIVAKVDELMQLVDKLES